MSSGLVNVLRANKYSFVFLLVNCSGFCETKPTTIKVGDTVKEFFFWMVSLFIV